MSLGLVGEVRACSAPRRVDSAPSKGEIVTAASLTACVPAVAAGDPEALARLYDHTSRLVYNLALRILRRPDEAEEVALDVYAQVWRTAGSFDSNRGSVEAWLLMIARARAIDRLRARTARPDADGAALVELEIREDDRKVDGLLSAWDARGRVRTMLTRLATSDRRLVELAFFEGYTHRELAALLGLPLGTVKTRLRNSLLRMRRSLSRDGIHPPPSALRRRDCCVGEI